MINHTNNLPNDFFERKERLCRSIIGIRNANLSFFKLLEYRNKMEEYIISDKYDHIYGDRYNKNSQGDNVEKNLTLDSLLLNLNEEKNDNNNYQIRNDTINNQMNNDEINYQMRNAKTPAQIKSLANKLKSDYQEKNSFFHNLKNKLLFNKQKNSYKQLIIQLDKKIESYRRFNPHIDYFINEINKIQDLDGSFRQVYDNFDPTSKKTITSIIGLKTESVKLNNNYDGKIKDKEDSIKENIVDKKMNSKKEYNINKKVNSIDENIVDKKISNKDIINLHANSNFKSKYSKIDNEFDPSKYFSNNKFKSDINKLISYKNKNPYKDLNAIISECDINWINSKSEAIQTYQYALTSGYKINRYDKTIASKKMRTEMVKRYCLDTNISLTKIAEEISTKYNMNVSVSTIRNYSKKILGNNINRKNGNAKEALINYVKKIKQKQYLTTQ